MTDTEIITLMHQFRRDSEQYYQSFFDRMKRCQNFAVGDQWEADVKEYNKLRRKHTLTINRILPVVLDICGLQSQNKRDIKVYNRRGGTAAVANVLTHLAKHAMDESHAEFELDNASQDAITNGVGYIHVEVVKDRDPRTGQVIIERIDPFDVYPDPSVKEYDHNKTGKFFSFDKWPNKDLLDSKYPDKKDVLASTGYGSQQQSSGSFGKIVNFFYTAIGGRRSDYNRPEGQTERPIDKYRYCESHTYWKEWRNCGCLYRLDRDDTERLILTKQADITAAKRIAKEHPQLAAYFDTVLPILHHTIWCGDVVLEDQESIYGGLDCFPIIPIYAYWFNGYTFGIVENLIGPQEEHNWARSQVLNIIKRIANVGLVVKKLLPGAAEKLEEQIQNEFAILEEDKAGGKIEKIEPTRLPTGHQFIADRSARDIQEIGVPPSEPEQGSQKSLSGYAIALRQQDRLKSSSVIFKNFDYSMRLISEVVIEIIRVAGVYSPDEVRAIIDEKDLIDDKLLERAAEILTDRGIEVPTPPPELLAAMQNPAMLAQSQEQIQLYQQAKAKYEQVAKSIAEQILFEELKSMKAGKYGVHVSISQYAPTQRLAAFAQVVELHRLLIESNQPGVPRDMLIDAADVPNKEAMKATAPGAA